MKTSIKVRLIKLLNSDIEKFNRYIRFSLSIDFSFKANLSSADLSSADLSSANLSFADLRYADLSSADLSSANLSYADLSSADLSSANLRSADLRYADLSSADLSSANLDMCGYPLSCHSLSFKSDVKIRTQIAFHFASLIKHADQENVTEEEKKIYSGLLDYVNRFHRTDVNRLEKL